jgi:peroxiredoxin Q/BCP
MRRTLPPTPRIVLLIGIALVAAAVIAPAAARAATGATASGDSLVPPAAGVKAPEIDLETTAGKPARLKDYRGRWVVLYFYPKDFTAGCTLEAHNFQRDLEKYEKANAVILGVSVDSTRSHQEFCAKEKLTFTLLSDPDARMSKAYGSWMVYKGMTLSARNTFIIDPQGKIARVFTQVDPSRHSEEVLAALAELGNGGKRE